MKNWVTTLTMSLLLSLASSASAEWRVYDDNGDYVGVSDHGEAPGVVYTVHAGQEVELSVDPDGYIETAEGWPSFGYYTSIDCSGTPWFFTDGGNGSFAFEGVHYQYTNLLTSGTFTHGSYTYDGNNCEAFSNSRDAADYFIQAGTPFPNQPTFAEPLSYVWIEPSAIPAASGVFGGGIQALMGGLLAAAFFSLRERRNSAGSS